MTQGRRNDIIFLYIELHDFKNDYLIILIDFINLHDIYVI